MTTPKSNPDRRAPVEQGWHLDKKVPLSLILAMIVRLLRSSIVLYARLGVLRVMASGKGSCFVLQSTLCSISCNVTTARRHGNGSVIFIKRSSRGSNDKTRA